jgi:inner membrane protein
MPSICHEAPRLRPAPATQARDAGGITRTGGAQQQLGTWLDAPSRWGELACVDHIEVRFIEPIDIYALSDRALKYGFLFIATTFACFLLFELQKRLRIHPAQHLLVGLALAAFFLLLLGLSEHIAFAAAYAIAAAACIALLGYYLSTVLGGVRRGLSFAVMLTALYGALYGLLISEDNALLLGSLLVFALIATAMVLTRKLDWYGLDARAA